MAAAGGDLFDQLGALNVTIRPVLKKPALDMSLHADNRGRLAVALRDAGAAAGAVVLLQGGEGEARHETDHEKLFRQESFFHWAFGVREPDCYGAVEVATGRATLFVPRLPEAYAVWMGPIKKPDEWAAIYGVDRVAFVDELAAVLAELTGMTATPPPAVPAPLLVLRGFNSDGKRYAKPARFDGDEKFRIDTGLLWPVITELRCLKTAKEVELLRYAAAVSSEAHIAVMQATRAGMSEYQLESLFRHWCYYYGGCRHTSYTCICASGHNGAVLHYGHAGEPNARVIQEGDLCLFDMGSEFACYGSDITTTFPVGGSFTQAQRLIYEAVLAAVRAVESAMKPGVMWTDMHALAYRTVLTALRDGGVLRGDVDAMMEANLGATFMPHGLGHFLGIDTHDVGGYPAGVERPTAAGYASLRTARTLAAGMYITVEPGCYFIDPLLDAALADPVKAGFIVPERLAIYRGTGGVRIEDDVLVTADGCENLTWAPRTVEDVEAACAGKITSIYQVAKFN